MNISVIGLGTVGMFFSEGLMAHGAPVIKGFGDSGNRAGEPIFEKRMETCRDMGINVVDSVEKAINGADIILVATTAAKALETAKKAKPYLKKGQIYVDLNSAVPSVKKQIEDTLEGIDVVDGTIMSSVNMIKFNAKVNFSGAKAKEVVDVFSKFGMKAKYLGDEVGKACALKVVRSIFMKGWEAILMECVHVAYNYNVLDEVLDSIAEYFDPSPLADHYNLFINTNVVFAKRRGEEMKEIAEMLAKDGLDNKMAIATTSKLEWLSSLGLDNHYENKVPNDKYDVIKQLHKRTADKRL